RLLIGGLVDVHGRNGNHNSLLPPSKLCQKQESAHPMTSSSWPRRQRRQSSVRRWPTNIERTNSARESRSKTLVALRTQTISSLPPLPLVYISRLCLHHTLMPNPHSHLTITPPATYHHSPNHPSASALPDTVHNAIH